MKNKTFVPLEQHLCIVCGLPHTNDCGIVMHKKPVPDIPENRHKVTGIEGLCKNCDSYNKRGYVALVAVDAATINPAKKTLLAGEPSRTGTVLHLKREAWSTVFKIPMPVDSKGAPLPMVFVPKEVTDGLIKHIPKEDCKTDTPV